MPEREYLVDREAMVDVTQSMACIQCGACVSDCLAMEVDPEFTGPAALAKAYRFVGDPRDAEHRERLTRLAEDPHGLYTCTHCFKCVDACPKGVNPMGQIMRLRRIAGSDFHIEDRNNGYRHEHAFVKNIRRNGLLHEADLLPGLLRRQVQPARGARADRLAADRDPRRAARQDHAGQGAAAPAQGLEGAARDLRQDRGQAGALRAEPLRQRHRRGQRAGGAGGGAVMKVAYWPGCVSRGFTPELHGSMALVAPLLDIELIELDRANCCGAGVIAEHNQELADTLNARTFALAQQTDGELMMNICSTCQGAQTECQERLDASADYRAHINDTLSSEGLRYERGITNKNFLWLLVEEIGLDALRREGQAAARPTCASARSTAATSCGPPSAWGSTTSTRASATSSR